MEITRIHVFDLSNVIFEIWKYQLYIEQDVFREPADTQ